VAEQWGRRWTTCDTSRVALTLARQRLMTAVFDYYELAHPHPNPLPKGESGRRPGEGMQGVWNGFRYKTVPHVTLKSIANNPEIDGIYARLHPAVEKALAELNAALKRPSPAGRGAGGEGASSKPKKALDPEFLEFARQLRREQTDTERLLWLLLRDRRFMGCKFRRQHPIEPYVVDFYCHEARLAIELDGGEHNEPAARARDEERTRFLEARGIRVLRFWNDEVFNNLEGVLQTIYEALTPTLSQGEREFTADISVARSGETLRQAEWRDELLRTGIRGKAGQYIRFARLEPLPGCRYLHADGEEAVASGEGLVDSKQGHGKTTIHYSLSTTHNRVVVSFGPEHAPLEQRQVEHA
jgi:adenine-specific DNA-methyltransferase